MDTAFTILAAIGGDGDIIKEALPLWQKAVPYACLAYTQIALWIGAYTRMLPYRVKDARLYWGAAIFFIPLLGALYANYYFRYSKFRNTPTAKEQQVAEEKAAKMATAEKAKRDAEARDSFKPFG